MSGLKERIDGWMVGLTGPAFYPLLILFGLNAVDELDREAFTVLSPNIREHFDLSIQGVLLLSSLVALAVLLLEVPLSHLADRRNRIRISVAGASAWGGFSVLTGLAANVPMLGVARAGAGLGRAVNGSTLQGEFGVGKQLLARSLHESSHRSNGPFKAIQCSALPHARIGHP